MSFQKPRFLAQRKGKVPILIGLLLCMSLVSGDIVSQANVVAIPDAIHEAARVRRVVRPKHKAAALLPVVDQDDIHADHRVLADAVLRALPAFCRENLKNFYVRYDPKNTNRGLGGASTIIVTGLVPNLEFMALIIHECGHVIDLGGLVGHADAGMTRFFDGSTPIYADDLSLSFYRISWLSASERKASAKDADFVSGYALSDPFEDFSETFAFFALQQQEFARLAASNAALRAKYDFMQNIVFSASGPVGNGLFRRGKSVPWDVTRLPYKWMSS